MLIDGWDFAMTSFAGFFSWWAGIFLSLRIGNFPIETGVETTEAPVLKLVYFNVTGIAQSVRDVLNFFSIPFEDERLTHEEFVKKKIDFPFGQLPIMTVKTADGKSATLAQSKSILRYVGRLTCTYPSKDPVNAAMIDQWCDLHTDFMGPLFLSMYPEKMGLNTFDREAHRTWIRETHLPRFLKLIDAALSEDEWFAGMDAINVADFCWKPTLEWLKSGVFDGVSNEDFEPYKALNKYMAKIGSRFDSEDEDSANEDENDEEAEEKKTQ